MKINKIIIIYNRITAIIKKKSKEIYGRMHKKMKIKEINVRIMKHMKINKNQCDNIKKKMKIK